MEYSALTIKEKLHQTIETIDDEKVLEALYYARDKNVNKIFCPGSEAMGIIVASPSCT